MALTSIQAPKANTAVFLLNRGNFGTVSDINAKGRNEIQIPKKEGSYSRSRVVNQ